MSRGGSGWQLQYKARTVQNMEQDKLRSVVALLVCCSGESELVLRFC